MPNYVSKHGKWYPSKERVALTNNSNEVIENPSEEGSIHAKEKVEPSSPFIYEGADRAALFEIYKSDPSGETDHLGQEFYDDVDLQDRARQRGYKSVADYAKAMGYDKLKAEERFEKLIGKVSKHELPKRVKMIKAAQSGGDDTSGQGNDVSGNFGPAPYVNK